MSRGLRDKIEYAMLCINKFAKAKELTAQQACSYLYDFKGLQFLDTAYPVESTLSSRIVVEDLHSVCQRNGGEMSDEAVIRALTRSALSHLVGQVMKVRGLGMPEAVKTVYVSRLYGLINDPRTGLYREGPLYLYDMLNEENQTGGNDVGS